MNALVRLGCAAIGTAFVALLFILCEVPVSGVAVLVLLAVAVACAVGGPAVLRVVLSVDLD